MTDQQTEMNAPHGITRTVGSAARVLGISAATLRTWDRRYGVGPAARTRGGHRRYSQDDLARARRMADLVADGASPESAARAVRAQHFR